MSLWLRELHSSSLAASPRSMGCPVDDPSASMSCPGVDPGTSERTAVNPDTHVNRRRIGGTVAGDVWSPTPSVAWCPVLLPAWEQELYMLTLTDDGPASGSAGGPACGCVVSGAECLLESLGRLDWLQSAIYSLFEET